MTATAELGQLPEWNLADLYAGLDSPQFAADLKRARRVTLKAFQKRRLMARVFEEVARMAAPLL